MDRARGVLVKGSGNKAERHVEASSWRNLKAKMGSLVMLQTFEQHCEKLDPVSCGERESECGA